MVTRIEAVDCAAMWAQGAEQALRDSVQARADARRLMGEDAYSTSPEVSRLISLADTRSDDVHVFLAISQAWAAIAAAVPEEPRP